MPQIYPRNSPRNASVNNCPPDSPQDCGVDYFCGDNARRTEYDLRPIASILRPIIKKLIVDRAIRGQISAPKAKRLIAARGLRGA